MTDSGSATDRTLLRVLVVCTANQCRSPMGEVIARDLGHRQNAQVEVRSAGTRSIVGAPATDRAVKAMRRRGLDLSNHLSQPVAPALLENADLVIAMERLHVIELVDQHGADWQKTFTLLELADRLAGTATQASDLDDWLESLRTGRTPLQTLSSRDIDDPTGGSLRQHTKSATLIASALETILREVGELCRKSAG